MIADFIERWSIQEMSDKLPAELPVRSKRILQATQDYDLLTAAEYRKLHEMDGLARELMTDVDSTREAVKLLRDRLGGTRALGEYLDAPFHTVSKWVRSNARAGLRRPQAPYVYLVLAAELMGEAGKGSKDLLADELRRLASRIETVGVC